MIHPKDDELSKEQHRHVPREHNDPAHEDKGIDEHGKPLAKPEKETPREGADKPTGQLPPKP